MHVFVYGTLTEPGQVGRLVDSFVFVGPATLEGFHPVQGRYPTLVPGGQTPGRLLRTDEIAALDTYEGVDSDLYTRVHVPLVGASGDDSLTDADTDETAGSIEGDGERATNDEADDTSEEVAVYVGDPERLDVDPDAAETADDGDSETVDGPGDVTALWSAEIDFVERVRRYVDATDVRVVIDGNTYSR